MIALWTALAFGADRDLRLTATAVAESWDDPAIASVYRSGGLLGGASVGMDVWGPLAVVTRFAYKRLGDEGGGTLELLPVTLAAEGQLPVADEVQAFADLGFTYVSWSERGPDLSLRGGRPTLEIDAGARWDTGLFTPPMAPAPRQPVEAVELELWLGRRTAFGGEGFHLGGWRGGLGVVARL